MKLLDRYIAQHLVLAIGFVILGLVGIHIFFDFVQELKIIGRGDYTLLTAIAYLALTLPRIIYITFPWAALLGALLGLGALAIRSELEAMQVASISIRRITLSVLKVALLLSFLIFLLGEFVAPRAEQLARRTKMAALSSGKSIQTAYGLWIRNGDQYIHIQQAYDDGTLSGITRYTINDETGVLYSVDFSESAHKEGNGFRLENLVGTRFLGTTVERIKKKTLYVEQLVDFDVLKTTEVKHLERLSLLQLWHSIQHNMKHELSTQSYELAFWTKIFHPFEILVMVCLAIPFIFGPLRNVSIGFKILTGILVGFGFYVVTAIFAPLTQMYALSPVIVAALPSVVFGLIGYYMMGRIR